MIQITAYLRNEEDLALWKAIGNKTQFLHDALHVQNTTMHGSIYGTAANTKQPIVATTPAPRPYAPPTEELPCCKSRQPCKHWTWDGTKGQYTNSISGRVVDVNQ